MFRRRTRNSTAYTGVGQPYTKQQQPSTNAMAAALTIGQNLKQAQPDVYGTKPPAQQFQKPVQPRTSGSLLKRSPSMAGQPIRATSTPQTSRNGLNMSGNNVPMQKSNSLARHSYAAPSGAQNSSRVTNRHSIQSINDRVEYSVDDSFNDSMIEEMGHAADAHYSNRKKMEDLKLLHTPVVPVVKMVKKYIPTPNGIKVVEVPELSLKQEIARSNSMRSGLSIGRSGLLRGPAPRVPRLGSLNLQLLQQRKRPPRLSSLLTSPRIVENVEAERSPVVESLEELADLQKQIEQEKQLALDLEAKRVEYEQLKALRLLNEKRFLELRRLEQEEASFSRDGTVSPASELNSVRHEPLPDSSSQNGADEDVPIVAVPAGVDELDALRVSRKKQADVDREQEELRDFHQEGEYLHPNSNNTQVNYIPRPDTHGDITSEYSIDASSMVSPEVQATEHITSDDKDNDFGIEEVLDDEDTPNLAKQLRPVFEPVEQVAPPSPKFDPVPEVIYDHPEDRSLSPPVVNTAGSIRSVGSGSLESRPIKSAMKKSPSMYNTGANTAESPAHQAYLSLTTAENTRLNSKLSTPQLAENGVSSDYRAPPKSPNVALKRMSQTLRKQPSAPVQGMAARNLRPRGTSDALIPNGVPTRPYKTVPLPLPAHPALQPNYQSPLKLKAAELYAKANGRPHSVFQPIQRLSSFSKNNEPPAQPEQPRKPTQTAHRTSMRPESYAPAPVQQPAVLNGSLKNFRSRLADSDDESHAAPASSGRGFRSRFNDSDEDLPSHASHRPTHDEVMRTPITSLRDQKAGKKAPPPEEKPKKKKFLKKLFGRN